MSEISLGDKPDTYSAAGKWLHWLTALAVVVIIPVGIVMHQLKPGALQNQLYDLHRSLGFVILVLTVLRLIAKIAYKTPAPYVGLTSFERVASSATHHLLYVFLIGMPLVGWAMTSAFGAPINIFGLFTLPDIVAKDMDLFRTLQPVHKWGGIAMAVLVLIHIAGALMHTFIKRDVVLWRMLPKSWS